MLLQHPGGVVAGDLWNVAQHLCQSGAGSELLRWPERQQRWLGGRSSDPLHLPNPLDPSQVEDTLRQQPFLCGQHPVLADLYVSVYLSTQEWRNNTDDHLYPFTVTWIHRIQRLFTAWTTVQYEVYLEAGALHATLGSPTAKRHEAADRIQEAASC